MKKLILLMLVLLMVGCASKPVKVVRTQYIFVGVPTNLTARVTPSVPFDPVHYSVQDCGVKEGLLFGLIAERTAELGVCNARLGGVSDWSIDQVEIYSKKE